MKRVERFRLHTLTQGGEVFVRGRLTREWTGHAESGREWLGVDFGGEGHKVPLENIVAMVVEDAPGDRYAFAADHAGPLTARVTSHERTQPIATPTARGTSLTFAKPEDAARYLEGMGWMVTPPDAHAEPIGEPRYYVRAVPVFGGADQYEVLDRKVMEKPRHLRKFGDRRAAGPFPTHHLAQAEADDLNLEDAAR